MLLAFFHLGPLEFDRWKSLTRLPVCKYNRIRAEIMEVRERIDSAIKFVGDVFYARVFRAAAESMGMFQYRAALDDKLR